MSGTNPEAPVEQTPEVNAAEIPKQEFQQQMAPADVAAAFFRKEKPVLKMLLAKMSAKEIRRTVMNAAAFPLIDKGDMPTTKEGKRAALLIGEMFLNKSLMVLTEEMNKA